MTAAEELFGDDFDFDAEDSTVVDKHGLSAMTGLLPKEVDKLMREGLPTYGDRTRGRAVRFSVPDCVQWLLERAGGSIESAKRRQIEATARKREAEAGKLEGGFVSIELVESVIRDQVSKLQSELMAIEARVPPEVRDAVRAEVHGAINRLAFEVPK